MMNFFFVLDRRFSVSADRLELKKLGLLCQ